MEAPKNPILCFTKVPDDFPQLLHTLKPYLTEKCFQLFHKKKLEERSSYYFEFQPDMQLSMTEVQEGKTLVRIIYIHNATTHVGQLEQFIMGMVVVSRERWCIHPIEGSSKLLGSSLPIIDACVTCGDTHVVGGMVQTCYKCRYDEQQVLLKIMDSVYCPVCNEEAVPDRPQAAFPHDQDILDWYIAKCRDNVTRQWAIDVFAAPTLNREHREKIIEEYYSRSVWRERSHEQESLKLYNNVDHTSRREARRMESKMLEEAMQKSLDMAYDQEQDRIRKNYEELKTSKQEVDYEDLSDLMSSSESSEETEESE